MTERGHYRFAAQEGARGEFWIVAEPAGDTIGSLDDRTLGFDLWPQATTEQANDVADFLNRTIWAITPR
jgi:hypothetical protein